ncbi:PD-(D/E)XK nuclease family protein [Roseisolibacter sp. H3M3-2]|uniref:PD-(D/E)XK nuclease family protein n=1 Tax=Roseisolibacter sp. H3M3-2 TaxID=3031323 RepID=UPI0023DB3DC1|nr:PD-(D/E)XK nuclease family protein [Roseisolibacter sp. H3M3-2]MDF1501318.1 PD-(D/E)XK nuclease family protein [Roseisolibacter sp. H3M3-2]
MAGYRRREYPEFSWSHSRDCLFTSCRHAYYLRYYGSHNGWEHGAPPTAHRAWALGKLTGVPSALGAAVHQRALECVAAVTAGAALRSAADLIERSRGELNQLRTMRDRTGFLARPTAKPMLHETYYFGRVRPEVVERTRSKLVRCTLNLLASPLWNDLRRCLDAGGEARVVDGRESFSFGELTIYGAPDLAYRGGPADRPVIVDWKTGELLGVVDQMAVQGLLVRDHLGWAPVDDRYTARVIGLSEGQEHQLALDGRDLADAETRIRASVERMRKVLADPDRNIARPADEYPMKWGSWRCRSCPYLELCRARVEEAANPGADAA